MGTFAKTSSWLTFLTTLLQVSGLNIGRAGTEPPVIGAYQKNFKGAVTGIISEYANTTIDFPYLDVHDNFYYGKTIQLNCNASYPVQWLYKGDGSPSAHAETFRYAPDFYSPATYLYQASVIFSHSHPKQTGNYSCQGINNPELESWFFVYVKENTTFLLDTEVTHNVFVNPKARDMSVNLPCTTSNSKAKVQIFRRLQQDVLKPITQRGFTSYDPTKGFRLGYKNYKHVLGNYTCIVTHDQGSEKLNFVVDLMQEAESEPVQATSLSFTVDDANDQILCCKSIEEKSLRPPVIRSTACESVTDCNLKRSYLTKKRCPKGNCETHVVKVNSSCSAYELSETRDSGILECSSGDVKIYHQFSKEEDVIITNFDRMPATGDILTIMKEPHPKDENVDKYICHSNSFFFATGLKMAWENADGSLAFIEERSFPLSNNFEVDDDHNHTTLYCFAPVWNSNTEWKNVSFHLI